MRRKREHGTFQDAMKRLEDFKKTMEAIKPWLPKRICLKPPPWRPWRTE